MTRLRRTTDTPDREVSQALRRAGVTDVDVSTRRRAEYSSDASLYRVAPVAVVFPRRIDDVEAVLEVARSLDVPVTPRGAGTSIAGNAVGAGIVLDFSRHLARIEAIDPEAHTAVVEPGVVLSSLQEAAAPHGLRFGPDPSTHNRCTLGGMIGNNACGSRALSYGRTSDNVAALDVLTGRGERLQAAAGTDPGSSPTLLGLNEVVRANLDTIRGEFGRFTRQISGYGLEHLLPEQNFDVAKALVGTEGTCGIVLGATLRLVPTPPASVLVVLGYPDMATAADAVPALLPHRPVALEGMDARIIQVVRERRGDAAVPDLPAGNGWLFVELGGPSDAALSSAARGLVADADALDSTVVTDPGQAAGLWRIRQDGSGLSSRTAKGTAAHAGWEDAAVPPQGLGDYLRAFDALLDAHGLTGVPYGHFGDGCLHIRIDFPLDRAGGTSVFRRFLTEAARLVAAHGGSMSGEHGDGRARSELLPLMYSDAAIRAFAAVKAVFDPDDVLNPGVIVRPQPLDTELRVVDAPPVRSGLGFDYANDAGDFSAAVHRCIGIGKCRANTTGAGGVMCPSFLATGDERDSTRGRARVLQEMANGTLVTGGWRAPEARDVLDLCLSCKGCKSDCPTGVDMATYKAEVLHQAYRRRLRPASHYSLGWLPRWLRAAAYAPKVANRMLQAPPVAAVAKRLGGIDSRRPMPELAGETFSRWFANRRAPAEAQAGAPPVLLWADTFTNHFDPEVGIAAVRVMEDAGFDVRVPSRPLCCGLTWISTGQLTAAGRILRRTVDALAASVRAGVPVVGLEPSCTAVLREDAAELLGAGDDAARAVAEGTSTLAELLASDSTTWSPPRLDGVRVVAQPHCHHHAVMGWGADEALLRTAGADVSRVGGCCGLAGNFGMERGHYDVSVAVAETALLPAVRHAAHEVVLLADGFSCRTQLDHLAGRRGRHLAELLAERIVAEHRPAEARGPA